MLLLPSLHGGGAERVATFLLRGCDEQKYDVRIALLRRTGPYLAEVDPAKVMAAKAGERPLNVDAPNASQYRFRNLIASAVFAPVSIRRMIKDFAPDVVVSFLKGMSIATYWALKTIWRKPRWIAREGNNTFAVIDDELQSRWARFFIKRFVRLAYRKADRMLATSRDMARDLPARLSVNRHRIRAIHNAVDLERIERARHDPLEGGGEQFEFVVAAGRLEFQKGYDLLLEAFAKAEACAGLHLLVLGKGSLEEVLKSQAAGLGIASRVHFLGFVSNPWAYFAKARLFVLASRWEGFANVVAEALACGAPTVVSDCDYGPKEIVVDGESGLVVARESSSALAAGMDRVLGDRAFAASLSQGGIERARHFSVGRLVGEYCSLFDELCPGSGAEWQEPKPD
jgi:glycosyltransferase involved in cell wall biosynthesis